MRLPLSPEQPLPSEGRGSGSILLGGGDVEILLVKGVVVKDVVDGGQAGPVPGARVPGPHDVGHQHLPAHAASVVSRTSSCYSCHTSCHMLPRS